MKFHIKLSANSCPTVACGLPGTQHDAFLAEMCAEVQSNAKQTHSTVRD